MMTADQIRSKFLSFFKSKGHSVIASASVVPPEAEDKTVLFTTAGMQQFKRQFLGHITDFTRAATSQKCIRTDDLDQVGQTAFHHTFFEMLGNFSFGDYFKKDAIDWAWEFLTKEMQIPKEKLWVSVYKDDDEAANIWLNEVKIPANKLVRLGDKSNFWPSEAKEKGPNGPCGPCSEIFFDYGVNPNCPKGDKCDPDCSCGRFAEIWNLVFTQFNRKDGGVLEPLPSKNIDTGMGLERLCAVVQGVKTNFDTDLFVPIRQAIENECKTAKITLPARDALIISDHIRAIVFSIVDGVIPSNKERGAVVKRLINDCTDIILRAGGEPFLHKLIPVIAELMKNTYPEIDKKIYTTTAYVKKAEEDYQKVFRQMIPELEKHTKNTLQLPVPEKFEKLGDIAFIFRDTWGLALPTILATIKSSGATETDINGLLPVYEKFMEEQRQRSRASSKMQGDVFTGADLDIKGLKTVFCGYDQMKTQSNILKMFKGSQEISEAGKGDVVKIVLDQTPFYAESGGQIGDTGEIVTNSGKAKVTDTQKIGDVFIHTAEIIDGALKNTAVVEAVVDEERRKNIMRNHTATHLLQAAMRKVLGAHVQQQGSIVDEERLRFDFTHPTGLTPEQIRGIEDSVYQIILAAQPVVKETLSLEEAKKKGALAFFAEKYGNTVRVVSVPGYSTELCGGTHLTNTGEIGLFKIVSESAIAQGIRRIEAKTGWGALSFMNSRTDKLQELSRVLKAPEGEIPDRILALSNRIKQLEKELEKYRFDAIKSEIDGLLEKSPVVNGAKLVTAYFENVDIGTLRKINDLIKQQSKSAVAVLGSAIEGNAFVLVTVSDDLIKRGLDAGKIIAEIAPLIKGSGGGRPNMAQAGSKETSMVRDAVAQAKEIVQKKLNSI